MNFGWKKDRWNPRALYHTTWAAHEKVKLVVKDKVDLRKYAPPDAPWNQGAKGSCIGQGIAANITARAVEQKVYNRLNQRFSPEWIYDGARAIEGTSNWDAGAYPDDGYKWLQQHGCLPEEYAPYTERLITEPPDPKLDQYAGVWPEITYYRVDNGVVGLKQALSVGNFVSIGIPFFAKWEYPGKDGILSDVKPFDQVAGGHEMCLFGYFPVGKGKKIYFICLNSWGDWGEGGWCYIPQQAFKTFKKIWGYDAHFPRLPWK